MSKFTVTLPDIGEGVVEGEVIEWLKQPNDEVQQDEPIVIVMTDKATVELPAPKAGKLQKQYYQPGEIAIVGKPLYELDIEGEETATIIKPQEKKQEISEKKETEASVPRPRPIGQKALATPHTRHLAKELGIDINGFTGSGKEGRVTPEDLKGIQSKMTIETLPGDHTEPLIGIHRRMAETMAEAKRTIPHFTYTEQVNATRLVQLRASVKGEAENAGVHVTYMPLIIRALSKTLKEFPKLNSSYDATHQELILHEQQNIGIAMTTEMGLIVPALKNVETMGLEEVIRGYEDLKKRAVENRLQSSDMKGATITITNFGVLGGGGRWATPIITPPEVAILGVAKVQKLPVVKNGEVVAQDTLNISWSFDHRVIDGDMAATVSHHFGELIQNPAALL